jgi:hypothetical protein
VSPDGKALAYLSWRNNNPIFGDPRVLAIRDLETGETRELRPNLVYFDQVSWAPDGRAFVTAGTDPKGRDGVFRIDARTGDVSLVVQLPPGFERSSPQWSAHGQHIHYRVPLKADAINGGAALVERHLDSGAERELARGELGHISRSRMADGSPPRKSTGRRSRPLSSSSRLPAVNRASCSARRPPKASPSCFRACPGRRTAAVCSCGNGPHPAGWSCGWCRSMEPHHASSRSMSAAGPLAIADHISLSPDGRRIAFLSGQQIAEVWVLTFP